MNPRDLQRPLEIEGARDRVAAYLRRMAPTQSHEMQRAFLAAAEEIEHPLQVLLPGDPPLSEARARELAGLPPIPPEARWDGGAGVKS